MEIFSWLLEFCTAFYTTYTSVEPDDVEEILTTVTTAATSVGAPNVYVEKDDIENFKASAMYVESLSDEELSKMQQNLELVNFNYQDKDNIIDLGNQKTMK